MRIFTIGFTKKSAREFFRLVSDSGAKRLVDVRLNNISQLSGFAKRDDLSYFLGALCKVGYSHELALAPTSAMLDAYKKSSITWSDYERQFLELLRARRVEASISQELLDDAILLCSEQGPHKCHRRLVAEYFSRQWPDVLITHL